MSKKLIVTIIAVVLIAAVVGSCFALYYVKGADVVVNIAADYEAYTLEIGDVNNTGLDLTFASAGTNQAPTPKVVDLTLSVDHKSLVSSNSGVFKVALDSEDDLYQYVEVSVYTLVDNTPTTDITTAATGSGYQVALADTPVTVRVTFSLTAAALANYASVAEKTVDATITWEVAAASVWTYDADAYYLVGTINGVDNWAVSPANENVKLTPVQNDGNNVAVAYGVALTAGDEIKVVWNYKEENNQSSQWYGAGNANVAISTTGTYNIFLYDDNGYNVSAALVPNGD